MKNDDLRDRLRDWDPADENGKPDTGLLARVRRRLDSAEGPEWATGPQRGRPAAFAVRLRELLAAFDWAPMAGLAGAAVALAVVIWVAFSEPAPDRPLPILTVDAPSATDVEDPAGATGSEPRVTGAAAGATAPETQIADATHPDDADVEPGRPGTEPLLSTTTDAPGLTLATTAALPERPVQIVLTASNGTRVYWTHQPGSGS